MAHPGEHWKSMLDTNSQQFIQDLYVLNDAEMARKYGVHRKTIYNRRKLHEIPNPLTHGPQRPVFDIPEFEGANSSELWDLAEQLRQKILLDEYRMEECEISLMDEDPIMLVWLADWHIGHMGTDLGKLRNDLENIAEQPGVYVAFGGDYTENTNTTRAQRGTYHEQLLPIRIQKKLAEFAAELVSNKILVMLKGNHDAWSEQSDDFDFVEYLAKNLEVPYLGDWGFANISLGSEEYRGLMAHKGRGGGKDKAAPAKNLVDLMGDADFALSAHKHESALADTLVRNKPVITATAGSYLESGRFGRGIPVGSSVPAMPGIILFPDRHKAFGVRDAIEDMWVLEGARHYG